MAGFELLSDQGLRLDGRKASELRRIRCRMGVYGQADGSAYLEQGNTKVVIFKNKILPNASQKVNDILKNEIFDQKPTKCKNGISDVKEKEEDPCFYLIAKQSKSKRLFLFDPFELAASNRNLKEISPERFGVQNSVSHHELFNKYVIPSGGLRAGLANQVVILKIKV